MAATVQLRVILNEQGVIQKLEKIDKIADKLSGSPINIKIDAKDVDKLNKKVKKTSDLFKDLGREIGSELKSAIRSSFREALTEMKAVDSELVAIRKVTGATKAEMDALANSAYTVAKNLGATASQYLNAVAEFSRAGYGEQADQLGELAIMAARVGDTTQQTANQFLLSVDAAYKYNGSIESLTKVLDGANEIGNRFPTSVEKIAEGLGKVAPIAAQAHVGIDELTAAIGTITAVTQRSGQEASTALRALFLNIMGDTKTEIEDGAKWTAGEIEGLRDILREYAPEVIAAADATGTLINPMEAIGALAQSMESGFLTEQKLMDMINDIGGKLRSSQLLALVQNWDKYQQMLGTYAESTGSAMEEYSFYLDSWEAKTNQLNAAWTDFVQRGLETDTIKGFMDVLIEVIEHLGDFGSVLSVVLGLLIAIKGVEIANYFEKFKKSITGALGATTQFTTRLGVAAAAIGTIIGLLKAYSREQAINRQEQMDAADAAMEEAKNIFKLREEYEEINEAYQNGNASREELLRSADALYTALGNEAGEVNELATSYQNLTTAMTAATEATLIADRASQALARNAAYKELTNAFSKMVWKSPSLAKDFADVTGNNIYTAASLNDYKKFFDAVNIEYAKLVKAGKGDTYGGKVFAEFIREIGPLLVDYETYIKNLEAIDAALNGDMTLLNELLNEQAENADNAAESTDNFTNSVEGATEGIKNFNAALQGIEKGDVFQEYADMFEKVKELYDNGMFGSNAFKQGLIGLMGEDTIRNAFGGDLSDAADAFFGSKFIQSVYSEGGDDYGANAASYIARHQKEFEGVEVTKADDGTLTAMVTDLEAFAASANMSVDAAAALTDAWGIYTEGSLEAAEGTEEVAKAQKSVSEILEDAGDAFSGRVADAEKLKSALSEAGYSTEEVADAIGTLEGAGFNVTGEATEAAEALKETKEEAESVEETDPEVVVTADNSQAVSAINEVRNMTIADKHFNIVGHYSTEGNIPANAKGVKGSTGGISLVNDEPGGYNPELIVDNGMAYIAGGGDPTIVHLNPGATVYTATETREIFQRSGFAIPSHANGLYTGIPDSYRPQSSGTGNKRGSGSSKSSGSSNPEDLLENIEKYIDEVLEKAKDALDEQLEIIDKQLFYLKYQKEASEKATELEEARLELLEAEQSLLNANTERTVRYYNNLTGQWEWMADKREVLEAQEELAEAQKEVLEAEYEALEELWENLKDEIEKALENEETPDIAKLLEQLSKSSASDSLEGLKELLSSITEFTENPAAALLKEGEEISTEIIDGWVTSGLLNPGQMTQSMVLGLSGGITPKPTSLSNNTSIIQQNGGNTYINGVQIGSDMMQKPLSEILSVLPIYIGGN